MSDGPGWTPPVEPPGGHDAPAGPGAPPPGYGTPPPGSWGQPSPPGAWGQPGQPGYGQPGQPGAWGQQNSPWGAPPAAKPGVIPLRPLGMGEILDGAFTVIRHYPKVTLGLSAIVMAVSMVVQIALVSPWMFGDSSSSIEEINGTFTIAAIVGALFGAVAAAVLAGMLTSVMGEAVLGKPTTIGETWARIRPRIWALLGASIVGGLLPFLGLLLCIVPGVYLWGVWALITPALILERVGVRQAMRRSRRLAGPDFWRVWGTRAVATMVAGFLGGIITFPTQLLSTMVAEGGSDQAAALALGVLFLGQTIAGTITAPFGAGVLALIYIDRRMRAEGLDVTLAQAAATEAGRF